MEKLQRRIVERNGRHVHANKGKLFRYEHDRGHYIEIAPYAARVWLSAPDIAVTTLILLCFVTTRVTTCVWHSCTLAAAHTVTPRQDARSYSATSQSLSPASEFSTAPFSSLKRTSIYKDALQAAGIGVVYDRPQTRKEGMPNESASIRTDIAERTRGRLFRLQRPELKANIFFTRNAGVLRSRTHRPVDTQINENLWTSNACGKTLNTFLSGGTEPASRREESDERATSKIRLQSTPCWLATGAKVALQSKLAEGVREKKFDRPNIHHFRQSAACDDKHFQQPQDILTQEKNEAKQRANDTAVETRTTTGYKPPKRCSFLKMKVLSEDPEDWACHGGRAQHLRAQNGEQVLLPVIYGAAGCLSLSDHIAEDVSFLGQEKKEAADAGEGDSDEKRSEAAASKGGDSATEEPPDTEEPEEHPTTEEDEKEEEDTDTHQKHSNEENGEKGGSAVHLPNLLPIPNIAGALIKGATQTALKFFGLR